MKYKFRFIQNLKRLNLRKNIFWFVFFINLFGSLSGLDPQKKLTQYMLNSWKIERGLPNNSVLAIAQDHSGYLWLGTANGLVRFDGSRFSGYNSRNPAEFKDEIVNNLYIDRREVLWITTLHGKLLTLEHERLVNHRFPQRITSISFNCLAADERGTLWIGTSEGLFYRPCGSNGVIQKCTALPGIKISSLAADRSGRLFVGLANKDLYCLSGGQWRSLLSANTVLGSDISAILQDRKGNLWLGTDDGLYRMRNGVLSHFLLSPGLSNNITVLVEDRDGNLLAGSEEGLIRWRDGDFECLSEEHGLASGYISSLLEDAEGNLWVGAFDGGLTQVRVENITALTKEEGLVGKIFRSLLQDDAGALWIGGFGNFLNRYKDGRCENIILPMRFKNTNIYALENDGGGALWLGTSSGILHFHEGRFLEIALPLANGASEVHCLLRDNSQRLWIGTYGEGLWCRQGGILKHYSSAEGLPDDRIASIFQDRSEKMWVGCENGLAVMSWGDVGKFSLEPFLNNCHVVSFYEDEHGSMWIGTRNQGLKVCQNGRWGSLSNDRGLFDSRIYAILEDDHGYLWMSGERGIFRAKKDELEKAAFDENLKVSGRLFDESDGMKSRICNYGNPAGWKDYSGRLWFANLAGVVSIDPAHIRKNEKEPPVLVEEVLVDQKNILVPDSGQPHKVKLPAGSRRFEFHYTALSFIRSDKIEFKYKLDGYEKDWIPAGNRRQAFYNNLKPGHYRFRVIAANADGVWNTAGASFAFYLQPFVYQTWWFLVLAALAFAVLSGFSWQLLKKYLRAVSFWKKKTHIGHFRILETIGSGGMATVYKAQDTLDMKRIVALKVLKEENFNDENQKKRFKHEALITEQLDHPHIVHIVERGETDGCWYIAMELLRGQSLAVLIRGSERLEIAAVLDIMLQVVDALKSIHGHHIVHRDLKPENIMVSEDRGRRYFVKLLDFGLAITPAQSRLTMSGVVMGTIRYLPPERISDGTSSAAGDIYSAGVILYEMLTGAKPFWSEATGEVIHRILKTYPPAPMEISREIPQELNALIMAMLDKEPQRRPGLAEIEATLQRLLEKFGPVS